MNKELISIIVPIYNAENYLEKCIQSLINQTYGVDGLIHISQIADRRIGKPEDVLSEGQEVDAKIIDIDAENKRISLSIRALLTAAEDEEPAVEE